MTGLTAEELAAVCGRAEALPRVLDEEVEAGRFTRDADGRYALVVSAFERSLLAAVLAWDDGQGRDPPPAAYSNNGSNAAGGGREELPMNGNTNGTTQSYDPVRRIRMSVADLERLPVHRHAGIFPALEGDQRERVRESMRRRGYDDLYPIVVSKETGEIVDGRNRRDIAVELKLADVAVVERSFADDAEVAAFIVAANIDRRHLNARQLRELVGRLVTVNGLSTRQAAKIADVSQMTAQRAAAKARAGESNDSPAAKARTVGADGKSYPATKAKTSRASGAKPDRALLLNRAGYGLETVRRQFDHFAETHLSRPLTPAMREQVVGYANCARTLVAVLAALAADQPLAETREAVEEALRAATR